MASTLLNARQSATCALSGSSSCVNVGEVERWASIAGGGLLALAGLRQATLGGFGLAILGGGLIYRGMTGHCSLYSALGVNTDSKPEHTSIPAGRGVRVDRSITVHRPASELYREWRNFDKLPQFMTHLVSVKSEGNRSHWVAKAPAGMTVQWDAEIITDEPGKLIGWRSLDGSTVANAGSVHFSAAPGGSSTNVRVELKYDPPAGKLGSWLAWAFGEEPGKQISDDLQRFKQQMETRQHAYA